MSTPPLNKGTRMYYETLSEDPSDLINEPEESKAAKDEVKAAAGKVVMQAAAGADVPAQAAPTQKEIADFMARMSPEDKDRVLVAYGVSSKKTRVPKGLYKTQCEDAIKKIKPTFKYIKDNHNVHLECYMLGLFLKDITDALTERDDHDVFKRWLTDNKEYFGLKKQPRKSGSVSTNVSVALRVCLIRVLSMRTKTKKLARARSRELVRIRCAYCCSVM
jgi:hypothetical protein